MEIRGSLKGLHSPDLMDMHVNYPEDAQNFCILVQAMIGPEGGKGSESFDFQVCSPQWLADNIPSDGYLFGKNRLLLQFYSYQSIWNAIDLLCKRTWGRDWGEVARKLGRFGKWEFEDYKVR